MYMIYIGIDISKYKHDCFICNDTGDVIVENLSFENTKHFTYAKFAKLKELAKNTIGVSNEIFKIELQTLISPFYEINSKINAIDKQISTIVKELNPPTLSIPGIGELTTTISSLNLEISTNFLMQTNYYHSLA